MRPVLFRFHEACTEEFLFTFEKQQITYRFHRQRAFEKVLYTRVYIFIGIICQRTNKPVCRKQCEGSLLV